MRWLFTLAFGLALGVTTTTAEAQRVGTLEQWKQRVLDPATLGIEVFPSSQKNIKFTIDQIRMDETKAQMVIYIIDHEQMAAAAAFYAEQLGQPVDTTGVGTLGELRVVKAAPTESKRAGLSVRVENAQWATGKGQVWLRYDAPQGP
jgi:hypothetical protein